MKKLVTGIVAAAFLFVTPLMLQSCSKDDQANQEDLYIDSPEGDEHEEPTRDDD